MQISLWKRFSYSVCLTASVAVAATAYASGPSVRTVQLRDNCDPETFNANLPPNPDGSPACVGDGNTEFFDFLDEFVAQGSVDKWRFNPDKTKAERGVNAHNRGGEVHTFTQVDEFGGGFVEVLNGGAVRDGGIEPVNECASRTDGVLDRDADGNLIPALPALLSFVPPDGNSQTTSLTEGVHKFQCCIHPWMQTTVKVK